MTAYPDLTQHAHGNQRKAAVEKYIHQGEKPGVVGLLVPSGAKARQIAFRRIACWFAALAVAMTPGVAGGSTPQVWVTNADRTQLLAPAYPIADRGAAIDIGLDPTRRFQPITGFGFTLTGGSAELLQRMTPPARAALLRELFGRGRGSIGVSWLRISIGSSDMDRHVFSYDDGPADPTLARFTLAEDERWLIPTLREILAIAPDLPILASPWSPPLWMKTNSLPKGGSLRPDMVDTYARYLVRYVREMAAHGVPIWGITPQNEPGNAGNTPSMLMTAAEQAELIGGHLGPALRAAGLTTRILTFDHNANYPGYPLAVENDPRAGPFVTGAAFHLYEGDPAALTAVHDARPDKPLWLTEQMVIDDPKTGAPTPIAQPLSRIVLAALNNWAQGVLLWNLAADPSYGPHTGDGGCSICEGAVTLDGDHVTRNAGYATVAQFGRFVPRGSVRIATSGGGGLPAVAFERPDGGLVLVVANPGAACAVRVKGPAGTVNFAVPARGGLTIMWPSR